LLFIQWNIERGYQLAGIIEELRSINADVPSLQEVDVGCERSGGVDTGASHFSLLFSTASADLTSRLQACC
jgi:endonuclease/exonuclease/phosphatase family metal-dependent hydrolase